MIKNNILFFLILLFINQCGYEPIYSNKNIKFNIKKIKIENNLNIGRQLKNRLEIFSSDGPKNGSLILRNYDGQLYNFGDQNSNLKSQIKIYDSKFYFNIIKGGSSALAESYIKNDFETSNLSSLIELTAKNINLL